MSSITVNETEFYYECHGEGQPVVLISGYASTHENWIPIFDGLAEHYQVCLFDNRGVGQTQDDGRQISVELMAEDTMALINTLNLKKPHIVGSSMGGNIALTLAKQFTDDIGKLVVLGTTAKWSPAISLQFHNLLKLRALGIDAELYAKILMSLCFGDQFLSSKTYTDGFVENFIDTQNAQTYEDQQRQYHALANFDYTKELDSITTETLIINGAQDVLSLARDSKLLAKHMPNTQQLELACGHMFTYEKPREVLKALLDFLQ